MGGGSTATGITGLSSDSAQSNSRRQAVELSTSREMIALNVSQSAIRRRISKNQSWPPCSDESCQVSAQNAQMFDKLLDVRLVLTGVGDEDFARMPRARRPRRRTVSSLSLAEAVMASVLLSLMSR